MATKYLDNTGLAYFWSKLKAYFAPKAHTHNAFETKHSYTTAANAAKNWYRIANANTSQTNTTKPLQVHFILTSYNTSYDANYYERWYIICTVFGRAVHITLFGNHNVPFSQARILYENTTANVDSSDRPAIDIYLNNQLANGTTKIEVEEVYNSGWTFVANGQLAVSTIPTGFENATMSPRNTGISNCTNADYANRIAINRSNITANITLADNNTYRAMVLNCTNAITVTVPSINSIYSWFIIKNFNAASTNKNVTIHPSTTSVLIDDSNADIVLKPGEWVVIASKAANSYTLISDGRWKSQKANKATTLAGYGITDAKIANGTITLGSNSITPLTSVPSHNQASNTITAMTGYSKPNSTSAITTSDTLNQAIGKLEKTIDDADISNTMHLTGNEIISGVKTFTSQLVKSTDTYTLDYNVGSSFIEPGILLFKNTEISQDIAYIYFGRYSDRRNTFCLRTKNEDNSIWGELGVSCTYDGRVEAFVSTGSNGSYLSPDNSNDGTLATTKWVRRYCETTKGYITSSDSITGNAATVTGTAGTSELSWNTEVTLATIGGNAVKAKLPANPNTNTTYTFAAGDSNGQIKVTPSNGSAQNVDVKGLGSAAFTESTSFLSRSSNNSVTSFHFFHRDVANSGICFGGGDGTTNGAYVSLYGQTASNAGKVLIHAKNSSTDSELALAPGGTASWKGQAIQTSSDERIKTPISNVSNDILDAWEDVQWGQFKFLDAIEGKGDKARFHVGLIAQAVHRTFEKHGADILKYGILCHEKQDAAENEPAVDLWMVRYTEALCMEAAYQRRRADRLEARIAALEEKLNG